MATGSFNIKMASSQESDLSEYALDKMEVEARLKSTKRSSNGDSAVFSKWQDKREIRTDMESVTENTLADHLRKFYAEVKTANGKATGICTAI